MVACTSGVAVIHAPSAALTARNATATATHQGAQRYTAAGKRRVKNSATSRRAGVCAPVTAARARATSVDRRPTSAGSGAADRTVDRCVAARW
jgi:hypothetical protein